MPVIRNYGDSMPVKRKQRKVEIMKVKALEALIDSKNISEAAAKSGIARRTLYDYLQNDPEFAKAFKAVQDRMIIDRLDAVEADRRRALSTVFALMDDKEQPGAVRLRAAQTILEMGEAVTQAARIVAKENLTALGITDGAADDDMPTIIINMNDDRIDDA